MADIRDKLIAALRGTARGVTTGVLGGPVDLANMLLAGKGGEKPVMGGKWVGEKLEGLGLLPPEQTGPVGQVAEFAGGFVNPSAPAAAAGKVAAAMKSPALIGALLGAGGKKSLISDWNWRPLADVKQELDLTKVPEYIQEGYGKFMQEQSARAARGDLGPRDLIKAYGITRSSVNRAGRDVADDLVSGNTRPEGYMAEWLLSPHGKSYLDKAEKGGVDELALADIRERFAPFGMADTLAKDLRYGAENLSGLNVNPNEAITGGTDAWRTFAQDLKGIGPAKSGFLASLLGRGDLPTLDARQLVLQTGEPAGAASKFMRRGGGAGGDEAVDRLANRQSELALALDPSLAPQYQHLTHHAIWDKVGKSKTTHDDLVRAMKLAGFGGATALGSYLLGNPDEAIQ